MAKKSNFFWVFLILFTNPVLSQSTEFTYHGFKGFTKNDITLSGSAEIQKNGILKLTTNTMGMIGHAFYPTPIAFKNSTTHKKPFSFSTAFAFAIKTEKRNQGGHGLAFLISPSKDFSNAVANQYLGLLNPETNGNSSNHLFAVEFDTVQSLNFKDISDNHVGIDLNGLTSNASVNASYFVDSSRRELDLKSGKTIQAWIDYDSGENRLNVMLSFSSTKPENPVLSVEVDLSLIVEDSMYVGFSASTGVLMSSHYIQGWSFKMNGKSQSLELSSLPSVPKPKQSNKALITGVSISIVFAIISVSAMAFYLIRRIRNADVIEAWELNIGPHRFAYEELKQATEGFGDENLLGFGGFGRVYRGTLSNSNTQVAVKRISHDSKQGLREYASEISTIGRLRHRNLVQLLGWCRKGGDLLLVYDFMSNGSLDKYIFDEPKLVLSWEQRLKIIKGVASGLLYLHEGWEETVIHRDIKSGNVLLDSEFNGRLGDFGLARLYKHGSNPGTTRVVGTLGYMAPELTRTGKPTTSSDVYAFGAFLLEVVCGRRPIELKALPEELVLMDWVWERCKQGAVFDTVDKRLGGEFDENEVVMVINLGLMCSNNVVARRPSMRQVVRYLDGEEGLPELVAPLSEECDRTESFEFENFKVSLETSSYFEKVSLNSADGDRDGNVDIEALR